MKAWIRVFAIDENKIQRRLDISLERLPPTELFPEVTSVLTFISYIEKKICSMWLSATGDGILGTELDEKDFLTLIQFQLTLPKPFNSREAKDPRMGRRGSEQRGCLSTAPHSPGFRAPSPAVEFGPLRRGARAAPTEAAVTCRAGPALPANRGALRAQCRPGGDRSRCPRGSPRGRAGLGPTSASRSSACGGWHARSPGGTDDAALQPRRRRGGGSRDAPAVLTWRGPSRALLGSWLGRCRAQGDRGSLATAFSAAGGAGTRGAGGAAQARLGGSGRAAAESEPRRRGRARASSREGALSGAAAALSF